jgi:hypothetical protein
MRPELYKLMRAYNLSGRELKLIIKRYRIKFEQQRNIFYVEQKINKYLSTT